MEREDSEPNSPTALPELVISAFTTPARTPDHGASVAIREAAADAVAAGLLILACVAMALLSPVHHVDWVAAGAGVALYAAAWQVTFTAGHGTSTPLQLVFVPMWFAVPPAMLPLVAAAGQIVAWLIQSRLGVARKPLAGSVAAVADSWHAVGPAALLVVFGLPDPSMRSLLLVGAGVALQLAIHSGVSRARQWAKGSPQSPFVSRRVLLANAGVDLALAPVGLIFAIVLRDALWPLLLVVPFMVLLAHFAHERDERIEHALTLSAAYRGTAALMGDVLEADDEYTGGEHTHGVVDMSLAAGAALGLDPVAIRNLEFGALLHDVGKLRVPNEIINKPGRLNAEEWEIIKQHPAIGAEMLLRVGGVLAEVAPIVRAHHERFDGAGYPDGLAGEAIPIEARIITVCDSFSAMTTNRSYRQAMSHHEAVAELRRCTPGQFDPVVVDALVASLHTEPTEALHIAAPVHRPGPASTAEPGVAVGLAVAVAMVDVVDDEHVVCDNVA